MKDNTLTIMDWDDTLFPTSWVVKNEIDLTTDKDIQKYMIVFSRLDSLLVDVLHKFISVGNVAIVTNASTRWIAISCEVLPNTKRLLNDKVKLISARDLHQNNFPDNIHMWKKITFKDHADHYKHVISIGDADYEFNALIGLYSCRHKKYLKTIRFLSSPTFEAIIDQLTVLNKNAKHICKYKRHMDLVFEKKMFGYQ